MNTRGIMLYNPLKSTIQKSRKKIKWRCFVLLKGKKEKPMNKARTPQLKERDGQLGQAKTNSN